MITLREQKVDDAQRLFEIATHPEFKFLETIVHSVEEEISFIKKNLEKVKTSKERHYTILFNNKIIGLCNIVKDPKWNHIAKIGYFIAFEEWGKGHATQVAKKLEKICFEEMNIKRIQIFLNVKNTASEKVAIKAGFKKEGTLEKLFYYKEKDEYADAYLYAKTT